MDRHITESSNTEAKSTEFVPPRHWLGPEELEAGYWNDPKVKEKRGQEFFEKPIEYLASLDKSDKGGIARRDFLTIMGASMAMTTFACARRPVHKIIPYVVKPEEITLGVPNWYASTYTEGPHSYGVLVKTREGRPIKIEGNPDHPVSKGAASARAQASVLDLYDPDRLKVPVMHTRGGAAGTGKQVSWADLDKAVAAKLSGVAAGAGRVRLLTGEVYSESTQRLIREFLGAFKAGAHVSYEPFAQDDLVEAQSQSYGAAVVPMYQFDAAEYILSLGADFLTDWLSPVEYASGWAKNRKVDSKNMKLSKLVVFEPTMTVTGANADERYPVRPGDELKIALAVAHELIIGQKRSAYSGDAAVTGVLAGYRPETVAEEIGLEGGAAKIKKIAHDMWEKRGKGLVVAGSPQSKTKTALALQIAVNLLNSALENEGSTVDGTLRTSALNSSFAGMQKLIGEMKAGSVDALIIYRTNPAFTLPSDLGFEEALKKVPVVIVIADREDETALLADFIVPNNHYLESWGDATPRKGLYSLQQPTIAPIHGTRSLEESLLSWTKAAALNVRGIAAQAADWHAYLQANWKETVFRQAKTASTFDQFWEGALRAGVVDLQLAGKAAARSFRTASVAQLPKYSANTAQGMILAMYASTAMYDGRFANNAWLQELPDPISSVTWDNYLNVAPQTAKRLSLKENDVVEVKAGNVAVQLPVHVQPGMHPNVVSVALGYGRRSAGKVGTLTGVNVYPLASSEGGVLAFSGQPVALRKTERMYQLAATQWHTASENRPIINDITLAEFKQNPHAANHTDPHLRLETVPTMWPRHEYKGYRWGMSIDLNSCIGCGACAIACQAENNIPVVGRNQVRNSRQMHWIRIDRYYSGAAENPDVVFQPMLCQHCENAPCETVCPVIATMHDSEGLNVQVYNRCVGTRYCQNNCPYKVRRFNFFDHWKSYEGEMNLVWNPEVTVRTRGIMEKCTFCVQRIRDAKDRAKDMNTKVGDADLKTACQQTCPTNAIVFGDINSKDSMVSKLRNEARAFKVLEVVNTEPVISYQTKVRNKESAASHHGAGAHHS